MTVAGTDWCHFDRWFALVADADFGADLGLLEAALVGRLKNSLSGQRDTEAKLSHLTDLRARLTAAGITATDLARSEPPDRATLAKARRKVGDQAVEWRAMTPAMIGSPRALLQRRARYGHWDRFPVDPGPWRRRLAGPRARPVFVPKGRSFDLVQKLRERLARHERACRSAGDRLALHRAFHTVALEAADEADDSYGVIGELRLDAFTAYLDLDWHDAGMAPLHWWQDLCELLVWEPYGLAHDRKTLPFERLDPEHADAVEGILIGLSEEHRAVHLAYEAEEALQLTAWLAVAGRRYDRYQQTARRLGSDHWMPVVALAESALAGGQPTLAVEVFRGANQPGRHADHLRARCLELTGTTLGEPSPILRVIG